MRKFYLTLIFCFLVFYKSEAQTCTVTGGSFADVQALEAHLFSQTSGFACTNIIVTGSIDLACSNNPITLDFFGSSINLVTEITDGFNITSCPSVTSIVGFKNLRSVGGNFTINSNNQLSNIGGFDKLSLIDGSFSIIGNDQLINVGNFDDLCSVGNFFTINNNDKLVDVGNFKNLCSIEENFTISGNNLLTNIEEFNNLCSVGGSFQVFSNIGLADCCTFKYILDSGGIEGSIIIFNNASGSGCETEPDIHASCDVDPITSTCVDDFSIAISDCVFTSVTTCSLIDGPCCGFVASINGVDIGDQYEFDCNNISEYVFTIDDGLGNLCEVIVTIDNGLDPCTHIDYSLEDSTLDNITLRVKDEIFLKNVTLENSSVVNMSAGEMILVEPLFEVPLGATIELKIEDCNIEP